MPRVPEVQPETQHLCSDCSKLIQTCVDLWAEVKTITGWPDARHCHYHLEPECCPLCWKIVKSAGHHIEYGVDGKPLALDYQCNVESGIKDAYGKLNTVGAFCLTKYDSEHFMRNWYFKLLVLNKDESGPYHERAIYSSTRSMSFVDRLPVIREWIQESEADRTRTSIEATKFVPSRLVEISGNADERRLRLVSRLQDTNDDARYTTLSHRWGPGTAETETTTANLQDRHEFIDTDCLPSTFVDAIRISEALGVGYIWIDSLCIIQDDPRDWEMEAALMEKIYHHTFLNIAAIDSKDGEQGCYLDSIEPIMEACLPAGRFRVRAAPAEHKSVHMSPLLDRGWVFQELELSSRVLYCGQSQFYFQFEGQFGSQNRAEDGLIIPTHVKFNERDEAPEPTHPESDSFRPSAEWQKLDSATHLWWSWAKMISSSRFTVESDRVPAMAGLVVRFQGIHAGFTPLLGLWKEMIETDLGWSVRDFEPSRVDIANLPSWSWLLMRSAELVSAGRPTGAVSDRLELLDAQVAWESTPMTSAVKSSLLVVRSKLGLSTMSSKAPKHDPLRLPQRKSEYRLDDASGVTVHVDDPSRIGAVDRMTVQVLVLFSEYVGFGSDQIYCLVLQRVAASGERDVYRRLGMCVMHCPSRIEDNSPDAILKCPVTTLELV